MQCPECGVSFGHQRGCLRGSAQELGSTFGPSVVIPVAASLFLWAELAIHVDGAMGNFNPGASLFLSMTGSLLIACAYLYAHLLFMDHGWRERKTEWQTKEMIFIHKFMLWFTILWFLCLVPSCSFKLGPAVNHFLWGMGFLTGFTPVFGGFAYAVYIVRRAIKENKSG